MDIRSVTAAVRTWPLSLGQKGALPNFYDLVLFAFIAAAFVALAHGAREMKAPLASLDLAPVTLDPVKLPEYALRTTLSLQFIAIACDCEIPPLRVPPLAFFALTSSSIQKMASRRS